jgi:uncharacterized protein (TIGR01777 family)
VEAHAWDPEKEPPAIEVFQGVEGIFHLAGEAVADGRWTPERKQRIRASRVLGTRHLVARFTGLANPPKILVCASAVGYYGDRGTAELDESSSNGEGFLAEVCAEWESEARQAERLGVRVVNVRIGLVLTRDGGVLAKLVTPFRLGLGGRLGHGQQWIPWIAIDDVIGIFLFASQNPQIHGPINAVSPNPLTNADFTQALARALHRPAMLPLPSLALRLALGEMSQLLLVSQRVLPAAVLGHGYTFKEPDLNAYLKRLLTKTS